MGIDWEIDALMGRWDRLSADNADWRGYLVHAKDAGAWRVFSHGGTEMSSGAVCITTRSVGMSD